MKGLRLLAVVLLVLGVLALVYQGFSYTEKKHEAKVGPLQFEVNKKERVEVPTWVGVALVAAGGGLLLVRGRR